jgi:hypothetical protein
MKKLILWLSLAVFTVSVPLAWARDASREELMRLSREQQTQEKVAAEKAKAEATKAQESQSRTNERSGN